MTLAGIALRNLVHRPWRSLMTLGGVILSIAAFVALIGLARGLESAFSESIDGRQTDVLLTEKGINDPMASTVPERLAEEVALVPGVVAATAELTRLTTSSTGATLVVMAWPEGSFGWETQELLRGRYPFLSDGGGVVVGQGLAERMQLDLCDEIEVFSAPFRIVGITDSDSYVNRNMVIGLLPDFQAQTYREGQATAIALDLEAGTSPDERDRLLDELRRRFPNFAIETTEALVRNHNYLQIGKALAWAVSVVALISAALAVMNTMAMAVNERRGEIAIMGAVGWPGRRIIACLMLEGALLSLIGGIGGAFLGSVVAHAATQSRTVSGFLEPQISTGLLVQAVVLALVIGTAGALLPAWRATRHNPAAILRGR
jgi:putative ABC transport system permease protein